MCRPARVGAAVETVWAGEPETRHPAVTEDPRFGHRPAVPANTECSSEGRGRPHPRAHVRRRPRSAPTRGQHWIRGQRRIRGQHQTRGQRRPPRAPAARPCGPPLGTGPVYGRSEGALAHGSGPFATPVSLPRPGSMAWSSSFRKDARQAFQYEGPAPRGGPSAAPAGRAELQGSPPTRSHPDVTGGSGRSTWLLIYLFFWWRN